MSCRVYHFYRGFYNVAAPVVPKVVQDTLRAVARRTMTVSLAQLDDQILKLGD